MENKKRTKYEIRKEEAMLKKIEKQKARELHEQLKKYVIEEAIRWEGVEQTSTPNYIGLRIHNKMFAEISVNYKFLKILTNNIFLEKTEELYKGIELKEGLKVKITPDSFGWVLNNLYEVKTKEQAEIVLIQLKKAYEKQKEIQVEKMDKKNKLAKAN